MSYSTSLYRNVEQVPAEDWKSSLTDPTDPFMDLRLLAAIERSMAAESQFFYLIVRDDRGQPMACAAVCTYRVDGAALAGPFLRRLTTAVRRLWPGYMRFKILLCGLPVSAGQKHLWIHPAADLDSTLASLDQTLDDLARRDGAWVIVAKEFTEADRRQLDSLSQRGYLLADSLPMNHFEPRFRDIEDYCRALRSHYRYKIKKSLRKFDAAGMRLETLNGPEQILPVYTDSMHRLYEAVVDRAEHKLEVLPAEFFRQLVKQLPEDVSLSVVRHDRRIVAFGWGLTRGGVYRSLFIGIDYSINSEVDLYFNTMLRGIDVALRSEVSDIYVGQAADEFKARIGCYQQRRFIYLKSPQRLFQWILRRAVGIVFPTPPLPATHDLFKPAEADSTIADGTRSEPAT